MLCCQFRSSITDFRPQLANFARQSLVASAVCPKQHSGSTLIDRTEVNDPEQKLAEAATHHLTTLDE
jgi:hypothetical protein